MARKSKLVDELVPVPIPTRLPGEYELGTWAKLPQWRCKMCGFDTMLGERPMLEHLVNVHNSEPALELLVGPVEISESEVKNDAKTDLDENAGGGSVSGLSTS